MSNERLDTSSPPSSEKQLSTGVWWKDYWLAAKKISVVDDLSNIGQIPCARSSLMSGIASGVAIGFIRGMTTTPFAAANWAVGTFAFVSLGTWEVCRASLRSEMAKIQAIKEEIPKRRLARLKEAAASAPETKTTEENATKEKPERSWWRLW